MESNTIIFLIVAAAAIAILYFAWPRKKAAPPKIEAPAQQVTPPVAPKVAEPEPVAAQPVKVVAAKPKAKAKAPAKAKAAPAKTAKAAAPVKKPAAKPAAKAEAKPVAKKAPAKAEPKAKAAAPAKAKAEPKAKAAAPKAAAPAAKAAAKPKAAPKAKAAPKPKTAAPKPAAAPAIPDNIELLKGVGPKLVVQLKSLGVTSLQQIAGWSAADVTEIDSKLGAFAGRPTRDNWIDQAKLLAAGDIAGFEKKYGALGSEIAKG